jgi:hypothetical protein
MEHTSRRTNRYPLRLPDELRKQLEGEAKRATRTLHNEIIHRLRVSIKQTDQRDREGGGP